MSFASRAVQIGMGLNLVAYINFSDALKSAQEKDRLLALNHDNLDYLSKLPPFFGVPISCKE